MPTYLGYASQLQDSSGLIYMRARWYDPNVGRFMTRDPLGVSAGAPANAFAYGAGNPIFASDPTGLAAKIDDGGACDDSCKPELLEDVIKASLDAGLETGGAYGASRIAMTTSATLSVGIISGPDYQYVRVDYRVTQRAPLAKSLLEGAARGAAAAGFAQGLADFFFHPELTPGQRTGRVAVAVGIGLLAAVATPFVLAAVGISTVGVVGFVAGTAVAVGIGIAVDAVVTKPLIYPRLGLGN